MTPETYEDNFFKYHLHDSLKSAKEVIPIVNALLQPKSVIDIGCGIGAWLSVWEENGVDDVYGVDGEYINTNELLIDKSKFSHFDLESKYKSNRQFDLASCLEVAEHISSQSAMLLIKSLCDLSSVVMFSAAIPGQEGTLHINEQYPDYWIDLFGKNGYLPIDCIRRAIWTNDNVSWWYRQNILLFVNKNHINTNKILRKEYELTDPNFLNLVHPSYFDYKNDKIQQYENDIINYRKQITYYENMLTSPKTLAKQILKKLLIRNNGK